MEEMFIADDMKRFGKNLQQKIEKTIKDEFSKTDITRSIGYLNINIFENPDKTNVENESLASCSIWARTDKELKAILIQTLDFIRKTFSDLDA